MTTTTPTRGLLDLDAITKEWLTQCGPHDYGVDSAGCNCPPGEPRPVISNLVAEVERLRNMSAALHDLCRPADNYDASDPESVEGGAYYMRLAGDDPMDYDPNATPTLAVAVSDVLRILDGGAR